MNFPFYIARRYLFSKKSHNAINVISGISVCGVALATLALVCTLSVFNGFQDLVSNLFTAFDPELKIIPSAGKVFDGKDKSIAAVRKMPEVALVCESLEDNALVQYQGRQAMAVIKGVEDNFTELTPIDTILLERETCCCMMKWWIMPFPACSCWPIWVPVSAFSIHSRCMLPSVERR